MSRITKVLSSIGISAPQTTPLEWEENATLKSTISSANYGHLLGSTPLSLVEVDMWLTFSLQDIGDAHLSALNEILLFKTFLVGNSISLADYAVYIAIASNAINFGKHANVKRWFKNIQASSKPVDGISAVVDASPFAPTFIPFPVVDNGEVKTVEATPAVTAPSATPTTVPEAAKTEKKDKKETKQDKETKESKPTTTTTPTTPSVESLDPTKLDIRCGVVTKCWNHPDSEKLLCEEIDLGNGDVRSIASGIRAFYEADQLVGKKVVVLANLKERSIGGFKSQGMVLCAVSADHSVIRLLEAPTNANAGDRVTFPPFPADSVAATPAQMVKKKILEGLAPGLRTDSAGVAHWNNAPFTIGAGVCSAAGVADAIVS